MSHFLTLMIVVIFFKEMERDCCSDSDVDISDTEIAACVQHVYDFYKRLKIILIKIIVLHIT